MLLIVALLLALLSVWVWYAGDTDNAVMTLPGLGTIRGVRVALIMVPVLTFIYWVVLGLLFGSPAHAAAQPFEDRYNICRCEGCYWDYQSGTCKRTYRETTPYPYNYTPPPRRYDEPPAYCGRGYHPCNNEPRRCCPNY